jgi:hypothetical protein
LWTIKEEGRRKKEEGRRNLRFLIFNFYRNYAGLFKNPVSASTFLEKNDDFGQKTGFLGKFYFNF